MATKLLLDSKPLSVLPELACLVGLNEAIVLQQLHYWIETNKKAGRNLHEGYVWTYNSYEAWKEQFPFWSVATIKRILTSLKGRNLVIVGNYNKHQFDQTLWYRINYNALSELVSGIGEVNLTQCIRSNCTNAEPRGFPDGTTKKVRSFQEFQQDRNSPYSTPAEEDHKRIKEVGI